VTTETTNEQFADGDPMDLMSEEDYVRLRMDQARANHEMRLELTRLREVSADLLKALKAAVDSTAGHVRWCLYCGHPDDAGVKPMPHTDTCWVPAADKAIFKAEGGQP